MSFLEMSCINFKGKDIHNILAIFRLLTNPLRNNLNKNCKSVYVISIVTR